MAFRPAGLISRDEPIAKRSPAMTNVSPRWTRARKSGIRYRNDPAFQRSSSVSRLSDTQSAAGVIWSVSIASSFFFFSSTFRSQKIRALPRMGTVDASAAVTERVVLPLQGAVLEGGGRAGAVASPPLDHRRRQRPH